MYCEKFNWQVISVGIPSDKEFEMPILKLLSDNKVHNLKEIREYCTDSISLSEDDKNQCYQHSGQNILSNRISWAVKHLSLKGAVERLETATYTITPIGEKLAYNNKQYQ